MNTLYRSGLLLLIGVMPVIVFSQDTKAQGDKGSGLVSFSGITTNAKAVSWDDPVSLDGRVVRLRDLWVLASGLSDSSAALNLHIPATKTPAGSELTPQPPKANQRCADHPDSASGSACLPLQPNNP